MSQSDVIVIGGGVIGVCAAYYLAKNRQKVTLLEQNDLSSGASYGNAGQITPGHLPLNRPGTMWRNLKMLMNSQSPLYIPPRMDWKLAAWLWRFHRACNRRQVRETTTILAELGHASFAQFQQLAKAFDFGFYDGGNLEVCETEQALSQVRKEAELLHTMGFESRSMTARELFEFESAITGDVAGAVHNLKSATCNPEAFVLGLAQAAQDSGADIRTETQVVEVQHRSPNRVVVITDTDEIQADSVVIACGAWTPKLAAQLGLRLPIQPGKGYHLDLKANGCCPKTPFVLREKRIFIAKIDNFLRMAGTMEFSGFNLVERPERLKMLSTGSRQHLAGIDKAQTLSQWCHLRPMSPDGLPMLGPIPGARNIWIAAGHGMLGLTQGPITGKIVADALTSGVSKINITALRPDRFQGVRKIALSAMMTSIIEIFRGGYSPASDFPSSKRK